MKHKCRQVGTNGDENVNVVIARPPITTFEGMLDRAIQNMDSPVKPENDGKEAIFV